MNRWRVFENKSPLIYVGDWLLIATALSEARAQLSVLTADLCYDLDGDKFNGIMGRSSVLTLLIAATLGAGALLQAAPTSSRACAVDIANMLALDQQSFDQSPSGWRQLEVPGCYRKAADLIRYWRRAHSSDSKMLLWHEGQNRAKAGQVRGAVRLFKASRKGESEEMAVPWNLYVDGSIAFLKRDRVALAGSRSALSALPKPASFRPVGPDGKPIQIPWPPNLNVLEGFQRCWDRPYNRAYSCASTSP